MGAQVKCQTRQWGSRLSSYFRSGPVSSNFPAFGKRFFPGPRSVSVKKIYVGNISFQSDETEIKNWFGDAGFTLANINLIRDKFSGDPRGFGFVEIENDEDAERAIQEMNGKELNGRALVINEARPMQERRPGGGGGGGRGRGPGGGGGGGGGRGGGGGGRGGRGGGGGGRDW